MKSNWSNQRYILFYETKMYGRFAQTLPPLTSAVSKGRKGDQSGSSERFFKLMMQKDGQTATRVIKPPLEVPETPMKALSNVYLGNDMLKIIENITLIILPPVSDCKQTNRRFRRHKKLSSYFFSAGPKYDL